VTSPANGAVGVMTGASLAVSIIGQSLAQARGLLSKHAIKQVDRLLSNEGIVVWDMFAPWVAGLVGARKTIVVAMDWTDCDAADQATLALSLVANHGRATPLLWLTVLKDALKVEANISRYKRVIGDALNSRHNDRRTTEVAIAVKSLNRMNQLGAAKFVRMA
jgi:hypothetical protein